MQAIYTTHSEAWLFVMVIALFLAGAASCLIVVTLLQRRRRRNPDAFLQMIIDTLPVGVFVKNIQGRYQLVNHLFARMMGYMDTEAVLDKTGAEIYPKNPLHAQRKDDICVNMRGGALVYEELYEIHGDQKVYEVVKTMHPLDETGDDYIIVGGMHDLTLRKNAEEKVKEERHFLLQLIDALPVLVCFIDTDRVVRLCNQNFCREAGVSEPSQLVGRHYDAVVPLGPPDAEIDAELFARGHGHADSELELIKNGRPRNFTLRRLIMSSADGQVLGMVKTFSDTTSLVAANRAAEAAAQAKAAFLDNMSHELRTPMNGILGMADLIAKREDVSPVQRLYAETVVKSALTLRMAIDEVMDVATLDKLDRRLTLVVQPFSLLKLSEMIANIAACIVEAWGARVSLSYDFSLSPGHIGDPSRICQIVTQALIHCSRLSDEQRLQMSVLSEPRASETAAAVENVVFEVHFQPRPEVDALDIEDMFAETAGPDGQSSGGVAERLGRPLVGKFIADMEGTLEVLEADEGVVCRVVLPLLSSTNNPGAIATPDFHGLRAVLASTRDKLTLPSRLCLEHAGATVTYRDSIAGLKSLLADQARRGEPMDVVMLDTTLAPEAEMPALLDDLSVERELGRPGLILVIRPEQIQSKVCAHPALSSMLVSPLCPSEVWSKVALVRDQLAAGETAENAAKKSTDIIKFRCGADVLMVEDNRVNQMVQLGMLKRIGCRTTLVNNGAEAVEKIRAGEKFDLVLMDCLMPIMDGFEATRQIRACEAESGAAKTPVVALTASNVEGDREKCLSAGMDDFLPKPLTIDMIIETLLKFCPDRARSPEMGTEAGGNS